MHRFYVTPERAADDRVMLCPREAHHALHVLRVRAGERVQLLDGLGQVIEAEVTRAARRQVELQVLERRRIPPPARRLALVVGLTKGAAFEDILQGITELGVAQLQPVWTRRVVVRLEPEAIASKLEKWRWIAVDALKQSGGAWLPEVGYPEPLESWLDRSQGWDWQVYGALEATQGTLRGRLLAYREAHGGRLPRTVAAYVGPEGDFTAEERAALDRAGAEGVSLGPHVLRSVTAALYLAVVFQYEGLGEGSEA